MCEFFRVNKKNGNIFVVSLHSGHDLRDEVVKAIKLREDERMREEDPYTDKLAGAIRGTQIVVNTSRFEVDLNRPKENCVYSTPDGAWGLNVWNGNLTGEIIEGSAKKHDEFYKYLKKLFSDIKGDFIVWDIHSYNLLRRDIRGSDEENPEINLGTVNNDIKWRDVEDLFVEKMRIKGYDVRKNVKFGGGYLSKWIRQNYRDRACCLAVDLEKIYL